MRLLLDTHTFLWLNSAPEKLSEKALQLCNDPTNMLFLSHVSPWEIQIKQQIGKLNLQAPLHELIETQQQESGLQLLPIELEHIYALSELPSHHRDPFDRLLIAQAIAESMSLVSVDRSLGRYPVRIEW